MTARAIRPGSPPTADLLVRSRERLGKRKDAGGLAHRDQVTLVEQAAAAVALREAAPKSPAVLDAAAALAIAVALGGREAPVTLPAATVAALLALVWPDRT